MFSPTDQPRMVEHPGWCDRTRCTTTAARSASEAHRGSYSLDRTEAVEHPGWCDHTWCTATSAVAQGGAHRGTPVTVTVPGIDGTVEITAVLSQAHCRWPTGVYVSFDVQRPRRTHQPTGGMAEVTVEKLAKIGQLVMDLAGMCGSDHSRNKPALRGALGPAHQPGRVAALAGGVRR